AQADALSTEATTLAGRIAELNGRIRGAPPEQAHALIAQRADAIQQLSSLVGVETIHRGDGTVQLNTAGGRPLVESTFPATVRVELGPPPQNTPRVVFEKANGQVLESMGPVGGQIGAVIETVTD